MSRAQFVREKQHVSLAIHACRHYTAHMEWNDRFMQVFSDAVLRFHEQTQVMVDHFFLPEEMALLEEIGCAPHELFDYVRDYATTGEPTPSTVLLIAAARRAFFVTALRGMAGGALLKESDIPRETEEYQDIAYLPRIIRKAEAKLYGTLPRGMAYFCPKDREFLRRHGRIHPADFLYVVWGAKGDKQKVVSHVLRSMKELEEQQSARAAMAARVAALTPEPEVSATND